MEEKILIQSNNDYAKKLQIISGIILAVSVLAISLMWHGGAPFIIAVLVLALFIVSLCLFFFSCAIVKTSITVSNKRVYGSTIFGRRVDLPFDSISAVGVRAFKGIAIGTSSGRISFMGIGNRDEIQDVISKLLIERQQKEATPTTTIRQEIPQSNADELKKYKDLLESGVITQEEFDAKKKQLLGL